MKISTGGLIPSMYIFFALIKTPSVVTNIRTTLLNIFTFYGLQIAGIYRLTYIF